MSPAFQFRTSLPTSAPAHPHGHDHARPLVIGHRGHVEVIGTLGERPGSTVVIESPEDALALEANGKPVAVIEASASLKLLLYLSVIGCVFTPWGVAVADGAGVELIPFSAETRMSGINDFAFKMEGKDYPVRLVPIPQARNSIPAA